MLLSKIQRMRNLTSLQSLLPQVQGHLKDLYRRLRYKLRGQRQQSRQSVSLTSSVQPRPSRPSLASIDTVASVILAPIHLTTSATSNNSDDGAGGGDGAGSWRIRIARMEESIAEQDPESDADSSVSTGDDFTTSRGRFHAGSEVSNPEGKDLCLDHGHRPAWAEKPVGTLPVQTETSADAVPEPENAENKIQGVTRAEKKRFPFFLKASGKRHKDVLRNTRKEETITQAGYSPKQTNTQCSPAIVIHFDEDDASNYTLAKTATPLDETNTDVPDTHATLYLTLSDPRTNGQIGRSPPYVENTSVASEEDGVYYKENICGEDSETLNLVDLNTDDERSDVAPRHDQTNNIHRRHTSVHHSFRNVNTSFRDSRKRRRNLTSAECDGRRLCDASSQGSDSAVSLASTLPNEPESDRTSMAETEDSGISCVPVKQDVTSQVEAIGLQSKRKLCYVNAAFENN